MFITGLYRRQAAGENTNVLWNRKKNKLQLTGNALRNGKIGAIHLDVVYQGILPGFVILYIEPVLSEARLTLAPHRQPLRRRWRHRDTTDSTAARYRVQLLTHSLKQKRGQRSSRYRCCLIIERLWTLNGVTVWRYVTSLTATGVTVTGYNKLHLKTSTRPAVISMCVSQFTSSTPS